jgi:CubicO group peptidase (beta-lactamase class C family)
MPALDDVAAIADRLFATDAPHGRSLAMVVQHDGRVVFERYGTQPDTVFGPGGPVSADTTLISWSMAKSITHAAVGLCVADGLLDVDAPAPVPAWRGTDKEAITLLQLLEMRSGLEFVEDYVDDAVSHCLEMLYGTGKDDMAAYAASLPLLHEPGTVWNYSSGTTNIVARIVGDVVGGGREGMERFLAERLFGPVGMTSATPKFDEAGTFVGSSYVYATARDFARFGRLYLDDGVTADGTRILPAGWRDHARTQVAVDVPEDGGVAFGYGRQWWLWPQFAGSLACHGYEGQYTIVVPDRDLVVVHLGKSPVDARGSLVAALAAIVGAFPVG